VWTVRTKKLGETVEHQVIVDVKKIADGSAILPHKPIKNRPRTITLPSWRFASTTACSWPVHLEELNSSSFHVSSGFPQRHPAAGCGACELVRGKTIRTVSTTQTKPTSKSSSSSGCNRTRLGWHSSARQREEAGFSDHSLWRVVKGLPGSCVQNLLRSVQGSNDLVNQRLVVKFTHEFEVVTLRRHSWLGDQEERVERSSGTLRTTETSLNSIASEATTAVAHHRLKQIRTRRVQA